MFICKHHAVAAFILAACLCGQQSIAVEDEDGFGDEELGESTDSEVVNMIADFLNNLDEEKAEELRKIIRETVDQPVKNDAKQYAIMFDKLAKSDSKAFAKIVNALAKEGKVCDELDLIANNCSSMVIKTMIRSAVKEAKEEN